MKIMNLTPHEIVIVGNGGAVTRVAPSGQVARVSVSQAKTWEFDGIPVFSQSAGEVVGLPEPVNGVALLVSAQVRLAVGATRPDVFSPGELIRNEAGQPIGCRGLVGNGGAA